MKKRGPKVAKSRAALLDDLKEQIELLCDYCRSFDDGKRRFAKPMSTSLRILLCGNAGNSISLLHQLDLRKVRFVDTCQPLPIKSRFPQCQLAAIHISGTEPQAEYVPMLSNLPYPPRQTPFAEWWTIPIIRDIRGHGFSRLELVQEVSNTDGGAHIDPGLNEAYSHFRSGTYMGWKIRSGEALSNIEDPHLACIRQITHETLLTLLGEVPERFQSGYQYPAESTKHLNGALLFGTNVDGAPGSVVPIIRIGATELVGEVG